MSDTVTLGIGACAVSRRSFLQKLGLGAALVAGSGVVTACGGEDAPSGPGAVTGIDAGHIPSDHYAPLYVAAAKGFFTEAGLDVQVKDFTSGASLIESFASGQLDVGWVGPPSRTAIARGIPIQIVAGCAQGGSGVTVRKPEIQALEDLRGRRLGVPARGTIPHLLVMKGLLDRGVNPDEVSLLEVADPTGMSLSLQNGEIDAAAYWEPWITRMKSEGARVLATSEQLWSGHQCDVLAASTSMIGDRPEIVQRIIEAHVRGIRFIESNYDEAVQIVADRLGVAVEVERQAIAGQKYTTEISQVRIDEEYQLLGRLGIVEPAKVPPWERLVNQELYQRALG